jgi:signal transduction histidine kinase/CheY-like chemotaxis protein
VNAKLLLVDDNKQSLKLLNAIFSIEGYETAVANDGAEAIDILKRFKIDLVISDILMPNVDGYYLCFKIRTDLQLKDIPVIIYTATYTSKSEEKLAMEMGADLFIRKPAPSQVLIDSAAKLLGNPQQQRQPVKKTAESFESMHKYSSDLITKLEQRNFELEKTTEDLERVLRQFNDAELIAGMGHWELDSTAMNIVASEAVYRLYGYESGSVKITPEWFLSKTHPDDRNRVKNLLDEIIFKSKPCSFSHRIILPGEIVRNIYTVTRIEFDHNGQQKTYGISIDTTLIMENEQKLFASYRELETFIYKAYHDLKSPSSSIIGLVTLASKEDDAATIRRYVTLIGDTARKQLRMIRNLNRTMLVRTLVPERNRVDIGAMIDKIIADIRETYNLSSLKIQIVNKVTIPVVTDADIIGDILHQVVLNAIQFADPAKSPQTVDIITAITKGTLEIEVADNGIGIEESAKSKIFDLYYRGSEMSKGSGIGLYLVKNAVEKLDGTISVTSRAGICTSVSIKIPLNDSH